MKKYVKIICLIWLGLGGLAFGQESTEDPIREITAIMPFAEGGQKLLVEEKGEYLVYEGDILVDELGRGGTARASESYLWPNSTIPFEIAANHPKEKDILKAIEKMNAETNLCLIPRNGKSYYDDYVEFIYKAGICGYSYVGMRGGKQVIAVGNLCGNTVISTMHEILHAAGFYHEQSHPDRDKHVKIDWWNIDKWKNWNNFFKKGKKLTEYDYYSIMHYSEYAFGNGKITITTLDPKYQKIIGRATELSPLDVFSIDKLYPKPGACEKGPRMTEIPEETDMSTYPIDIEYTGVELVPQLTNLSCWAAAISMIIGWVDEVSINPEEIARQIGYWKQYNFQGLAAGDFKALEEWGFELAAPMSYTAEGLADLLKTGPLWVATEEDLGKNKDQAHVRVIVAMIGDGSPENTLLTIYDPWEKGMKKFRLPNNGSIYQETFTEFSMKQADLATKELHESAPIYIAHLPFAQ